ncbi:hypothetical protein CYG49_04310 [Candidatus Saccharibacteria bacterium]|nr:MAG: hypothetical protein CYG49_04310 [Candidatus Saccharibacteria bacterium]
MARVFALIDCNNFFASCERVFRPDLWHKPVAVLSNNDGCIIARSNEVKALGVPMGVPLFKVEGLLKQHGAALFSANFTLYGDISQRITDVMSSMAPAIEVYSVDESFIDLTDLASSNYAAWAEEVRTRIWHETGIPVSIGIGPSKTLAKAAAEYAKRQGTTGTHLVLEPSDRLQLLEWLPLEDVWGIGRRFAAKLHAFGLRSAADVAALPDGWILKEMTIKGLTTVRELRGDTILLLEQDETERKTISRSRSFGHTIRNIHQLESAVATFTAQAMVKMRAQDSVTSGIVTYLKTKKVNDTNRNLATVTSFGEPSVDTGTAIQAAIEGLARIYDADFGYQKAGIILVGIQSKEAWQLSLLMPDSKRGKRTDLMSAVDLLNRRFGPETIWHASQNLRAARWHSKHELRSPAYTTSWHDLPTLHR